MCGRPPDVEHAYAEKARLRASRQEQYRKLRDVPAVTRDGVAVDLHMNAGLLVDLQHVAETGAASIGLFRTELQFMIAARFPRHAANRSSSTARRSTRVGRQPITFRTLDIGGDKVLPYMTPARRGKSGARLARDPHRARPAGLLRLQLRALLRAAAGRELRIMFPMVASLDEFEAARAMVERELALLKRHGRAGAGRSQARRHGRGALAALAARRASAAGVDFISVGSNDLVQYLYAADRDNKRVVRALRSACRRRSCGR